MVDTLQAGSSLRGLSYGEAISQDLEPAPSALLENTLHRLHRIGKVLCEGNTNLTDLRSRTFGPWPEDGAKGEIREASPPSQQARLSDALDRLESAARASLEHSISLNGSL